MYGGLLLNRGSLADELEGHIDYGVARLHVAYPKCQLRADTSPYPERTQGGVVRQKHLWCDIFALLAYFGLDTLIEHPRLRVTPTALVVGSFLLSCWHT